MESCFDCKHVKIENKRFRGASRSVDKWVGCELKIKKMDCFWFIHAFEQKEAPILAGYND